MERFSCKTQIISGAGAISQLGQLQIQRLLVVTDPYFMKNGMAEKLGGYSGAKQITYFDKVIPDPTVALAAEGAAILRKLQPDTVVALGGGSAMDCAKAMVYFGGKQTRLVAVPTTSGSGSEVTDFAVLTHEGVKHPLVDKAICPQVAILDSDLLKQLPPGLIADTGFDVLCHSLEAYVAKDSSPITDALAQASFSMAYANLPRSYRADQTVRLQMHTAATMAGMAFTNAGLGLCHAMAHSLGGLFHLPHGRLNAILLPSVISCNAFGAQEKYARLARSAGLGGSADAMAVRNLKNALIRLRQELHMPGNLAQAGIPPQKLRQHVHQLVAATLADPCCSTNPAKVEDFMVRRILEEVMGREP